MAEQKTPLEEFFAAFEAQFSGSPQTSRSLAMLAMAERWRGLFVYYDQVAKLPQRISEVLDRTWEGLFTFEEHPVLMQDLGNAVPGEDWVVDGLVDSVIQYGAVLIDCALAFQRGEGKGTPEHYSFEIIRLFLCDKWFGATELGFGEENTAFEERLVADRWFVEERRFIEEALRRAPSAPMDMAGFRNWATSHAVDVSGLV